MGEASLVDGSITARRGWRLLLLAFPRHCIRHCLQRGRHIARLLCRISHRGSEIILTCAPSPRLPVPSLSLHPPSPHQPPATLMASSGGNTNQFEVQKLFKPPTPNPNYTPNTNAPFPPPASFAASAPPLPFPATPPPGPFSFPPSNPPLHHNPFMHYPHENLHRPAVPFPVFPPELLNPNTNPNISGQNPGARLMALLGNTSPAQHEFSASMPLASAPNELPPMLHAVPSAPPAVMGLAQTPPAKMPSTKMPRGRPLGGGERAVHDVDARLPGEAQPPQLEVTPITKYVSDPGLVLGRQIAVNRTYICYGLKLGTIRVLNINTALRSLLRGHTQRVTDMAFFAEEVHLLASSSVDGKVFIWKIDEGPDHEDKPQITGKLVLAVQLVGDRDYHPRICWHSHKQEILIVGIGKLVLKFDTTKVGRGSEFSLDEPLKCSLEKLLEGVQLVGRHDAEVTDLSISQWMTTRIASASNDGTVKLWDDRKTVPLVTLRPHGGQPVNSLAFLTSPHRPDHIVLITSGPLNREVKMWSSMAEEGWLLPSDSESWQCTQTLELISSLEPILEEAFFNQVVVLPQASLILLANAKNNAIYAVHIEYGLYPAATHMDYIADFTVTMPILSLTGTTEILADGEQVVQVYCVQTQAIQQYALNLEQCLPPKVDNVLLAKDPCISHIYDGPSSEGFSAAKDSQGPIDIPLADPSPKPSHSFQSPAAVPNSSAPVSSDIKNIIHELSSQNFDAKLSAVPLTSVGSDSLHAASFPDPRTMDLLETPSALKSVTKGLEHNSAFGNRNFVSEHCEYPTEGLEHDVIRNVQDVRFLNDASRNDKLKAGQSDVSSHQNSNLILGLGGNTTHLVTPSEILSGAKNSSDSTPIKQKGETVFQDASVNKNPGLSKVYANPVDFSASDQSVTSDSHKEEQIASVEPLAEPSNVSSSQVNKNIPKEDGLLTDDPSNVNGVRMCDYAAEQCSGIDEENILTDIKDLSQMENELADIPAPKAGKAKKSKSKQSQASGPTSPHSSSFSLTDSFNEQGCSMDIPVTDQVFPQLLSVQQMLDELMSSQKEMQKQLITAMTVAIAKEGKRLEIALGRNMEKAVKANIDAFWMRFQEENAKREKTERDRLQQFTSLITNFVNKELPAILEKTLKKEFSSIGPAVARSISPAIDKTISSAIADSFQKGVGDKSVNQLEKAVNTKLESTVSRQIQAQFQTSGRQALQDALKSTLEVSLIPAFEQSCKAMFDQVDATFQKGLTEHTAAAQQQFDSAHSPLALTLRDSINSASSISQNFTTELADGQRKLLALFAGNPKALNPILLQQNSGPVGGVPEMALSVQQVEAPLDPMKELSWLISERKFNEAFTAALQRSDVSLVSWLCSQVDLHGLCSMVPLPLTQGVLLALLQQLACDIGNDTARRLGWMTEVAAAINPADPVISLHVRPIFKQVYTVLAHQRSLPTTTTTESSSIRIIMHVINSVLMSCK
ncbi:Enhancer of mRNA-decapping protein 4 [Apostasia shenzhenica]|uniref:Enhancer of mRNA-decapping protein 4 n=1 Tax=Apostasia shenzhenica TaxID=1088818 RepID=A0A2I0A4N7_9ASPA|nr:Enhancer of mRNA-decapping protein 4 [Apostasia shenzhenica]